MCIKNVMFKVKFVGHGVVNYDSSDQSYIYNKLVEDGEKSIHKNVSYAKKQFYVDKDGKTKYKLVISSDCLRHNIFIDDFMFQSPKVATYPDALKMSIGTVASMLRGYMFTSKNNGTQKRKSPITITEALQTCNAIPKIETFSKSGFKIIKEGEDKEHQDGDTTLFKRETIGDIEYESEGFIDIRELQFCSLSEQYGRMAFSSDEFKDIKTYLEKSIGSKIQETPQYYTPKNSSVCLPELGFMFTNKQQVKLVREFFKRLLRMTIKKTHSYARVSEVHVKFSSDPIMDNFESKRGWIKLTDENMIDFSPYNFYEKWDYDHGKTVEKESDEKFHKYCDDSKKINKEKQEAKNTRSSAKVATKKRRGRPPKAK